MRIASLLAACTEWIAALGAEDLLIGRSHECDYPPSVVDLPVLTRPMAGGETSEEIHDAVRSRLDAGLSLYKVDLELLRRLEPDLILTQTQCDVCAVSRAELEDSLGRIAVHPPELFSFEASTFKGVLDQALALGRRIGRMQECMAVVAEGETRLKRLRDDLGLRRGTPSDAFPHVLCIEWIQPLMTAGHWMPDLVELAGGHAVCTSRGRPSEPVDWPRVLEADPDLIAVTPCGFTVERTHREMQPLVDRPEWWDLSAVRSGDVVVCDGRSYFNRPGPRLYRAVELLAAALHGARSGVKVEPWEMQHVRTASPPAA